MAVHELVERFGLPVDGMKDLLAALASQPTVTRELLLRQFVEAWLAQQREGYGTREHGGHDD